jgi:hypothetical protein
VREHVPDLVHQVDAQVLVLDPDVDVHAADHQLAGHHLEVSGEPLIPGLFCRFLLHPIGEGVGG